MGESWMERVEAAGWPTTPDEWETLASLAREMAEDAEATRLLREEWPEGVSITRAYTPEMIRPDWRAWVTEPEQRMAYGRTPLAALQALAEAVKE